MKILIRSFLLALGVLLFTLIARAQDTRTVTEPTFPASCTVLYAQQAIVSGAPASETIFDTSRIQTALNSCVSGQAVELAPSLDGTDFAFLIAPITIPTGVGLIVDGGVTVFASRNPADYQISGAETCGTYGSTGAGCNNLINFPTNSTGSGIYGYGVITGRGGSTMLKSGVDSGISWWTNADSANTAGKSQDNPILMKPSHANSLTLYKITFRDSPMFHIGTSSVSGFTAWGIKIQAPFTAHNTDGIDPQGTNVTIKYASISDGDDNIAVGASSASSNVTIDHVTTYSGHGISIGSYTQGGLSNMVVSNLNMAGNNADGNATGLRIKSAADRGGTVQNITYKNVCIRDTRYPIQLNPFYNSNAGTTIPLYSNIVYQNVHVLAPTASTYPYKVQLEGYDSSHLSTVTFNNLVFDLPFTAASNITPTPQDLTVTLANNVYPADLTTLNAISGATNVSYSGSATVTATGAYDCSAISTIFPYLTGELYMTSGSANNLQAATITNRGGITLNAMVEPALSPTSFSGTVGSYTGAAALTKPVNFYEGSTLLGTGTLSANGTLASLALSNLTTGTHTYTAQYPGDTTYSALAFGSVTVTVNAATTSTTTLTAPSSAAYPAASTLTATVSASGGTPTGSVIFYDGSTSVAVAALSGGTTTSSVILGGGSHSIKAAYQGDANYAPSTSSASTLAVTKASSSALLSSTASSLLVGGSTAISVTVTGAGGGSTPTGSVAINDGSTTLTTLTLGTAGTASGTVTFTTSGTHSLTAVYGGDGNYTSSTSSAVAVAAVYPATPTVSSNTLSILPGASGSATITIASGGGYSGAVSVSCTSPVSYIACSMNPALVNVTTTTPATSIATVTVAATTSSTASNLHLAWLAPLALLAGFAGVRARRSARTLWLLLLTGIMLAGGLAGCSSGGSSTAKTNIPTGSQTLTITATASGLSQTTTITVNM